MLSNLFSKSYLLGSDDFLGLSLAIVFGRLLPIFDKAARMGSGADVFELSSAVAAEMMSAYQVGLDSSLDFTSPGREVWRKKHIENGKRKLRNLTGSKRAAKELEDECFQTCLKADEFVRSAKKKDTIPGKTAGDSNLQGNSRLPTTTRPIIFTQLSTSIPEEEGVKTPTETLYLIASELLDNIEAARVGIGIVLTYAMYRLSQRPDLQSKLRNELMTLTEQLAYPLHGPLSNVMLRQIDNIALLEAIVLETLRVHPSAPGPQYRAVPEGGVVIDSYFIPAGVSISTSPYCLHRHAGAYPEAEEWKPERWMAGQKEDDLRRWFWPFGKGSRMCMGSNFALVGEYLG
jgi:cytochrome P450